MDITPITSATLLDERSHPDFRTLFGQLLASSSRTYTAIRRIRLSGVDLTEEEVGGTRRLRVLVGEMNGQLMGMEAHAMLADPRRARNLRRVMDLLEGGRLEVRCSPLAGWNPDFTIFANEDRGPHTLLTGLHWMERPYPLRGPVFASLHGCNEAARALRRFEHIWRAGHDVGEPLMEVLIQTRANRHREG